MNRFMTRTVVVATALATIVGVSGAFFTYAGQTQATQMQSSSLTMNLTSSTPMVNNWLPGQEQMLEYSLQNVGTLPVQSKAFIAGVWEDPALDTSMVSVESIEIWQTNGWQQIAVTLPLGQEFMVIRQQGETEPTTLEPGETLQMRVTLRLSQDVTNEYQAGIFSASLHVAGKQLDAGADWPSTY